MDGIDGVIRPRGMGRWSRMVCKQGSLRAVEEDPPVPSQPYTQTGIPCHGGSGPRSSSSAPTGEAFRGPLAASSWCTLHLLPRYHKPSLPCTEDHRGFFFLFFPFPLRSVPFFACFLSQGPIFEIPITRATTASLRSNQPMQIAIEAIRAGASGSSQGASVGSQIPRRCTSCCF